MKEIEQIESEMEEWISNKVREDFIKLFRAKKNEEIKLKFGYDLLEAREKEWVGFSSRVKE
jgi:hypothetical protein